MREPAVQAQQGAVTGKGRGGDPGLLNSQKETVSMPGREEEP